jgi:hypothetical protein
MNTCASHLFICNLVILIKFSYQKKKRKNKIRTLPMVEWTGDEGRSLAAISPRAASSTPVGTVPMYLHRCCSVPSILSVDKETQKETQKKFYKEMDHHVPGSSFGTSPEEQHHQS